MQTAFARIPGGQASSGAPVSAATAAAQATTGAKAQKSSTGTAQATTGAQAQKSAESIQTAFARMPGGKASSGAPVSTAAASAQATTGEEAQKSAVEAAQVTTGRQTDRTRSVSTARLVLLLLRPDWSADLDFCGVDCADMFALMNTGCMCSNRSL